VADLWERIFAPSESLEEKDRRQEEQCDWHLSGWNKGFNRGMALFVLRALDQRGIAVPRGDGERIRSCRDTSQLVRWFDRAMVAERVEDVFD
jgi:hypothetical protein